ncbi:MAG: N-6 DNA methylase [Lutisporaceae bacterium]
MDVINKLYEKGRQMEKSKSISDRKGRGIFYTPIEVVDYMSMNIIRNVNLIENPYVRILDISCGAGYFLLKAFELIKTMFEQHLEDILNIHTELKGILSVDTIGKFVAENNIWGVDIDTDAVSFVKAALQEASGLGSSCSANIICADSLLSWVYDGELSWFWKQGFDIVIGNPPYIGHKAVPREYKEKLYKYYKDVYRDKADISYCFFKRGINLLKQEGILCFITSRYFIEGPSAMGLREFLNGYSIDEIVDFGDSKIFNDAGVSVCIISIRKGEGSKLVKVKKMPDKLGVKSDDLLIKGLEEFNISKDFLKNDGWVLLEPEKLEVFQLIDKLSTHSLDQIFDSCQGIITGCDRAFILSQEQAEELKIEKTLLRPWIKNSQVEKFFIKPSDKLIIYTNLIKQPEKYPVALGFAESYKDRLTQRRECQKGFREWYELQWGRDSKNFDSPKIIYPYKAAENRFAVDRNSLYCSADVYSLLLKDKYLEEFSLEYFAALLNSKLVEFYFKCYAKKINTALYDYYPNTVLRIKLKLDIISSEIIDLVKSLKNYQNTAENKCILQAIDREVYKMYSLTEKQIKTIENSAGE